MKKITEAGGKVLGEPVEIPGIGSYVSFIDTENNLILYKSLVRPVFAVQKLITGYT